MTEILSGITPLILIEVLVCLIVLGAMAIDLASGVAKAKMRGEARRSECLRRSLTKFITYQGGLLIAAGIDTLMFFCHFWTLIHVPLLEEVPGITCLLGIFLLAVEGLSIREKADEKTHANMVKVEHLAEKLVNKEELVQAFTEALISAREGRRKTHGRL